MNQHSIQMALFRKFGKKSQLMVPNYTPEKWYECDLYRVTKAGVSEEFEVKISLRDFRIDEEKGPTERQILLNRAMKREFDERTKHQRLEAGDPNGPARFWFVVPLKLVEKVEPLVPDWAGLMSCGRGRPKVVKKAPQLHRGKVPDSIVSHAKGVFYWRFWSMKARLK